MSRKVKKIQTGGKWLLGLGAAGFEVRILGRGGGGGMSIVVSRSYNTLNADKEGEFGYGWSLDLSNTKVEVKYPAGTDGSTAFEGTLPPFRDGTRVIVTLPDGKREGFAFYGAPGTQFFGQVFDWIPLRWG